MKKALEQAMESERAGEVPVGCIILDSEKKIIGWGRNRREETKSAISHAEIEAIEMACRAKGDWRLDDCSLYVTLEPCPMCAGAIINARISKIVYGAKEPLTGACGSVINLFMEYPNSAAVIGGVCKNECGEIMERFFKNRRRK